MNDRFESILDESISALQAGVPIEEILAEAPDLASELRPLLYAAMVLADPDPELIPEERKASLRAEYLAQATELATLSPGIGQRIQALARVIKKRLTPKDVLNDVFTVIITVLLTLAMVLIVLNFAAKDTIPGDFLYGVKRVSEAIQLGLTFDTAQKLTLEEELNTRRLAELDQLMEQGRAAVVNFRGVLETKGDNLWVIEGRPVFVPQDAILEGNPQEGDDVEVHGFLRRNNALIADEIKHIP